MEKWAECCDSCNYNRIVQSDQKMMDQKRQSKFFLTKKLFVFIMQMLKSVNPLKPLQKYCRRQNFPDFPITVF